MKTKVLLQLDWYGSVQEIHEDGTVVARMYNSKNHELVDVIEFSITNFSVQDRKDLVLNVIFTWRVGRIGKRPFSNFRIKRIENPRVKKMSYNEACELSRRMRDIDTSYFGDAE